MLHFNVLLDDSCRVADNNSVRVFTLARISRADVDNSPKRRKVLTEIDGNATAPRSGEEGTE